MSCRLLVVALASDQDVTTARQHARQVAQLLGFEAQDQIRIATAVCEVARNALHHAGGGSCEFVLEGEHAPQVLMVRIVDHGPGIDHGQQGLDGNAPPATGAGIAGCRRLLDQLDIRTRPGHGTEATLIKLLPARAPLMAGERLAALRSTLAQTAPATTLQELAQQNVELLYTLSELRQGQEDMERLNRELEDTNRGVVALYAELDERADHLRRADEMKTRFLSNMSHEFRTPLNSIRALSRLLLDRIDGPLNEEQATQVGLIGQATEDLTGLVDDLLDLVKIAAGKTEVRPSECRLAQLFVVLRSMLRPLLSGDAVALHFDDVATLPAMYTDEAKLSQILRNLISNALKYTEHGSVRVSACTGSDGQSLRIRVTDSGIGIEPQDRERIFDEFVQIAGPLQSRAKGTGLGLPLSRRLARLLGGTLSVESEPGVGSTFEVEIPLRYPHEAGEAPDDAQPPRVDPHRMSVMVIENDADALREIERMLQESAFQVLPARTIRQARDLLLSIRPAAAVVNADLRGEHGWAWLTELRRDPATSRLPVIVVAQADECAKAYALGADACLSKPLTAGALLAHLERSTAARVLVIDDDPTARYTVRRLLGPGVPLLEAEDGVSGLRAAAQLRPALILLDLQLPDLNGPEVLRQLKASPTTRDIAVAIVSSLELDEQAHAAFIAQGAVVVSKRNWNAEIVGALLRSVLAPAGMAEA